MRFALSMAALSAILFTGCNNKTPPGGGSGSGSGSTPPGGTGSPVAGPGQPTGSASDTFEVKMPSNTVPTTIKQGNSETVKLTVSRGKDFKQGVKIKLDTPDKIKADYKGTVAASDPEEVQVKLEVAKDAPIGEHTVKVTATPDKGAATSGEFKVKVTAP